MSVRNFQTKDGRAAEEEQPMVEDLRLIGGPSSALLDMDESSLEIPRQEIPSA
jgi:hypothetical protein